jgi:hypothetical protein
VKLGLKDPMKGFTEKVENEGGCGEAEWEASFLIVPAVYLKT